MIIGSGRQLTCAHALLFLHLPHPSFVFLTSMEADIRVERIGRCVMLRMERGENRMNPKFIEDMNQALDKAER